jgi:hypothetical protein
MASSGGAGFSEQTDSYRAGYEAAQTAVAEAGAPADLALVYCTSKQDPHQFHAGVRAAVGVDARIVGGHSVGAITREHLGYEGYQACVGVMSLPGTKIHMFLERSIGGRELEAGRKLGDQVAAISCEDPRNLLLTYDSVKGRTADRGLELNLATPLIEGVGQTIGTWPTVAGVGVFGDLQFNPTYQFFDDEVVQQTASALLMCGGVRMDTIILHGCEPAGRYHTITKAEGPVVLEIDGKPAVDMIAQLLGPGSNKSWEEYPLFVTLGVNRGERFGRFREEDYANRLCMAVDKARGGLVMFENDLQAGSDVQLMRRSIDFDYVGKRSDELLGRLDGRRPFFALYIDCAGRAAAYCGTEREEAEEVQRVIGGRMPLLGMYSGVEIARVGKQIQALDWTGVLCVFSES